MTDASMRPGTRRFDLVMAIAGGSLRDVEDVAARIEPHLGRR